MYFFAAPTRYSMGPMRIYHVSPITNTFTYSRRLYNNYIAHSRSVHHNNAPAITRFNNQSGNHISYYNRDTLTPRIETSATYQNQYHRVLHSSYSMVPRFQNRPHNPTFRCRGASAISTFQNRPYSCIPSRNGAATISSFQNRSSSRFSSRNATSTFQNQPPKPI